MKNLNVKLFSDIVYEKIEELKYKVVLTYPTTEDKEKKLIELHTPLKSNDKTKNAIPLRSTFQISVTCWNEKQRESMKMTDEVEEKLQEYNFVRTNTSPANYDTILQKYGITITFEVRYNAITDCFEQIR